MTHTHSVILIERSSGGVERDYNRTSAIREFPILVLYGPNRCVSTGVAVVVLTVDIPSTTLSNLYILYILFL